MQSIARCAWTPLLVALLAACGTPAPPSPASSGSTPVATNAAEATAPSSSTSPSAAATTEPTPDATETAKPVRLQWAQDPPRPILSGSAVVVVVDELNMRERPSTSAPVIGGVSRGNVLTISGPPVESGEYIWYQGVYVWGSPADVPALPGWLSPPVGERPSGWVAASTGATSYLEQMEPRCPAVVDLKNVVAMLPFERLECFGGRTIELKGSIGCVPCSPEIFGQYAPDWLTNPNRVDDLLWERYMRGGTVMLRFPPDGPGRPNAGEIISVRGHFRDAAAEKCELGLAFPWADSFRFHPVGPTVARQLCRQQFVVERYEVIGVDPRFEG